MAMAEMPGPYDVRNTNASSRGVDHQHLPDGALSRRIAAGHHLHDRAADGQGRRRLRHRSGRDPPPQPRSTHFPTSPRWASNYDEATYSETMDNGGRERSTSPAFRKRQSEARAARALSRHRLRDVLRAHRLRHARPSRRAAWRSRRAGRRSRSRWIRRALSRRASAPRRTARACAPRCAQIVADELGITPDMIKVVHGDTDRDALWLGHLRQPLAGDFRRRHADRRRKVRAKLHQDRQHAARGRSRRHRAR